MQIVRFSSPRLPSDVVIYVVPGWPSHAVAAAGREIVMVSQGKSRGATLIRCRKALRRLGIL